MAPLPVDPLPMEDADEALLAAHAGAGSAGRSCECKHTKQTKIKLSKQTNKQLKLEWGYACWVSKRISLL